MHTSVAPSRWRVDRRSEAIASEVYLDRLSLTSTTIVSSFLHLYGYLGCHRRLERQALSGTVPGEPGSAPPRRSMEVIVVDNASTDGTAEMIEARFPYVKLIRSSENLGFAKGNNVAIRQCQGRYIALVNPDVIVFSGLSGCAGGFPRSESQGRQCRSARLESGHDTCRARAGGFRRCGTISVRRPAWRLRSRTRGSSLANTCSTFPTTGRCPWMSWWVASR